MLEKLTLDAVLGFLKRYASIILPGLAVLGLVLALHITRGTLADVRKDLTSERSARAGYAVELGLPSNAKPEIIFAKLQAELQTSRNRETTLKQIDREAAEAKARSDAADQRLKQEQEANARRFSAAQAQITALQNRKSTGNAAADCAAIDEDSKAAWKGWK